MFSTPLLIVLGLGVVIGLYVMNLYNTLQRLKTQIQASLQEIGNQLKRQASLIPNLEASVKGYLGHEKDIFKSLTDARKAISAAEASHNPQDIEKATAQIQAMVPRLSVAVEDNPELKGDATVTRFMQELSDTADKLTYARRSVIDLSADYNARLVTFPSNMIAGWFGFQSEAGLKTPTTGAHVEVSEAETHDHKVSL
jgi:LemA protein